MNGNVCGDHELALTFASTTIDSVSNSSTVCYQGFNYGGTMEQFDTLDITLWYRSQSQIQSSCYLWCTDDGLVPTLPEGDSIADEQLILTLVCIFVC